MTTICVVQARYDSSRLPGKVLEQIGRLPMLVKVIERLKRSKTVDSIVVATTTASSDDAVADVARATNVVVTRGSVFDVLDRFHQALSRFPDATIVVRVTADCPFIDPEEVDRAVGELIEAGVDFVANRLPPPYARSYPVGLDVEVCTADALGRAWTEATAQHQREHVMPYIYEHREAFSTRILDLDDDLSQYRWTVDTHEDLEAVRLLDSLAGPEPFAWRRVLEVARAHPDIGLLNGIQRQKEVSEIDERWI